MEKTDLTQYSDDELSMLVFNDEGLYRERHRSYLKELLDECFIYTEAQYETLQEDLEEDLAEDER